MTAMSIIIGDIRAIHDGENTNSDLEGDESDKNASSNDIWNNQREWDEETDEERNVRPCQGPLPWDYFFMLTCTKYVLLHITRHNDTRYWLIVKW